MVLFCATIKASLGVGSFSNASTVISGIISILWVPNLEAFSSIVLSEPASLSAAITTPS